MNSGQMMLVILGAVILALLSLNVYKSSDIKKNSLTNNQSIIAGTGLAQAMMNEIKSRAFDQNTINAPVNSVASLTPPLLLGPDLGELIPTQFNDVDDFNNYTTSDTLNLFGIFNISVHVYYINTFSPGIKSLTQTFSKQVDISVTNSNIPFPLKFSQVISY